MSQEEIASRIEYYGSNQRKPIETRSFCRIVKDVASDFILIVLLIASISSIVINELVEEEKEIAWVDGFGIFLAVIIVISVICKQ